MNSNIYLLVEHLRGKITDITYTMLAAARELAQATGGEVTAILLGEHVSELAQGLAVDRVLLVEQAQLGEFSPDAYLQTLANLMQKKPGRIFLFGHTSIGMDVVCGLGARLNLPVISQCLRFSEDNGKITFVSQICGGKIMAEGVLPEESVLVSMVPGAYRPEPREIDREPVIETLDLPDMDQGRIWLSSYLEPDQADVDISKENILVAIGRGLQNETDLDLVEELVQAMGGTIVASRPIIDQGWLPTSRLVGKSGKSVKPKLYLALGISGAPEHVEGITGSDLIIAVNTDPSAPIFNVAQYGIQEDLIDVLSVLNERLESIA